MPPPNNHMHGKSEADTTARNIVYDSCPISLTENYQA